MSVLAVIPCLNEAEHLGGLLDQMLADPTIDLLVVADAGSTDGSRAIVEQRMAGTERLRLLDNPARIQSAGINLAVARFGARFQWLARIDAHCSYPDNYVRKLLAAAVEQDATAVVVPMETRGISGFQLASAAAQNSVLGTGGSPHRHVKHGRFVDHGHHALMRLDLFRNLGGYCEAMPCNEDAEFDHRQVLEGGRIWLEPGAAIIYYPRKSPASLWRQYFRYGVGRARNVRRHRLPLKLRQAAPLAVPLAVAALPLSAFHWIFAVPALLWLFASLLAGLVIGARAGGGWALAAGVAAATMHLAWGCGFLKEYLGGSSGPEPRYALDMPQNTSGQGLD